MDKMAELWKFQEADMVLIKYENKLKASPVRKKLAHARNVLMEGQNTMHAIEDAADKNQTLIVELDKRQKDCSAKLKKIMAKAENVDIDDLKTVQSAIKEAEEIQNELTAIRKEYSTIISKGEADTKTLAKLKDKLVQAKKEYVELKSKFEEESEKGVAEIKRLKEEVDKASKSVDKALLKKYMSVRKNCVPAVAKVEHGQCMGCNMSLPSLIMHNMKDSPDIFECENCGRILYLP